MGLADISCGTFSYFWHPPYGTFGHPLIVQRTACPVVLLGNMRPVALHATGLLRG
jgi:hypothetical protein